VMVHRSDLVAKLDVTSPAVMAKVNALQQGFIAKGKTPELALKAAYQLMDGGVMRQAAVLSYMDVFLYIGLLFLICVPFVLMIRTKKKAKLDMSQVH